jgi:hypothetical protein
MADLPEPVDITTSVSRPARMASMASRWPGRSDSYSKVSRATRSIGSMETAIAATLPVAAAR